MSLEVEYLILRRANGEESQWHAWQGRGYPTGLDHERLQTRTDELSRLVGPYFRFLPDKILTLAVALRTNEFLVVVKDLLPIPTYRGPIIIRYAVFDQPQDDYATMAYTE